jgi:hypothetical protein
LVFLGMLCIPSNPSSVYHIVCFQLDEYLNLVLVGEDQHGCLDLKSKYIDEYDMIRTTGIILRSNCTSDDVIQRLLLS